MAEDHFAHSILPPRPPSKRPFQIVIIVVVLILAAGLTVFYWPLLSAMVGSFKPAHSDATSVNAQAKEETTTAQEKKALLGTSETTAAAASSSVDVSTAQKQAILQPTAPSSVSAGATSGAGSQKSSTLTPAQKQNLLH